MTLIIAAVGLIAIAALFAALSGWEARQRRRLVQDVTRTSVRRYDLHGDLLPPQDTSLGPVDYRRVPSAEPVGYIQTTQQARYAPSTEASFLVPLLTAVSSSVVLTVAAGVLAWAFDWPVKVVAITFALSLVGAWLWRLGLADKTLWKVEQWTGRDFDGDGHAGRPAVGFATVNPGQARATVAQQSAQNATEQRREALQRFVDVCYLAGTSEAAHGITASGPDRENYVKCRDALFSLGLATWKNPNRPKGGWHMVADPATAKAIVASHVL